MKEGEQLKVYSVDEVTTCLKNIIERNNFFQNLWVRGEISNFKHHNGRHMYFTLKDENSIIECAMFCDSNMALQFQPKEGMQVVIKGHIGIYRKRGNYQLIAEEMQLAGGGELYLKFIMLKEKLEKEGLFNKEFKKEIPKFPRTIGIVTSIEGAAVQDILKTMGQRFPHVKILIYPSLVQGSEAKLQIVRGIEVLNALKVELIIIARGGGSFEDLWTFNEESVARAIFSSKVPIITGIGHETDFTIADFVADKRAHTPSAAAELSVPNISEAIASIRHIKKRLCREMSGIIEYFRQKLDNIKNREIFRKPFAIIREYAQVIDEKEAVLKKAMGAYNELLKKEIEILEGKLLALNPTAILKRGYTITMKEGKIIKSTKDIKRGEIIFTLVSDGSLVSKIEDKHEN